MSKAKSVERRAYDKKYYQNHKLQWSLRSLARNTRLKLAVFTHYSNGTPKCSCCGITDIDVLVLDHIANNGKKDRRGEGSSLYSILVAKGFPSGLQVLCCNCNFKKELHRRHQRRAVRLEQLKKPTSKGGEL